MTDDLIDRLSKEKNMPVKELKELREIGYFYNKERDSFIAPPEFNIDFKLRMKT